MNRRALIMGGACAAAAGAAYQLRPHRYVSLLGEAKLDDLVPRKFGPWTSEDIGDPLALNAEGTLSAKLYNQLVTRAYSDGAGRYVFVLLAHGERQSDELQLHRPEVCYPAFGYEVVKNEPAQIDLGRSTDIPARRLVATVEAGKESIIYWTRLGEFFPRSGGEQRSARFQNTAAGVVPDGILCRFSTGGESPEVWTNMDAFIRDLVLATIPQGRATLIGTDRSARLGRAA